MKDFLVSFTAVFVALDIIGTLPLYLSMTHQMDAPARRSIVNRSMVVAFVVAVGFALFGQFVFKHLGIDMIDFRMAGGLVLLLIALADLLGGPDGTKHSSGSTGVVPLAVPLITGPAVLTAIVLQIQAMGYVIALGAVVVNYVIAWGVLRKGDLIERWVGKDGTVVISKVMALLLAAIAVSMIRSGLVATFLSVGRPS